MVPMITPKRFALFSLAPPLLPGVSPGPGADAAPVFPMDGKPLLGDPLMDGPFFTFLSLPHQCSTLPLFSPKLDGLLLLELSLLNADALSFPPFWIRFAARLPFGVLKRGRPILFPSEMLAGAVCPIGGGQPFFFSHPVSSPGSADPRRKFSAPFFLFLSPRSGRSPNWPFFTRRSEADFVPTVTRQLEFPSGARRFSWKKYRRLPPLFFFH